MVERLIRERLDRSAAARGCGCFVMAWRWHHTGARLCVLLLVGACGSLSCGRRESEARPPATSAPAAESSPVQEPSATPARETDAMPAETPMRRANRLIHESSPYLLQHAYNPVDWHPWGEEALAKAKREDKPVLVSIGYSTCYWCHVMEQESFDNPAIAKLINEAVVPIKVDREERPDLDAIYMTAVQAMSGQGGWPLNVFLTPEGEPFWGGTYFPPEDRVGHPGFPTVLRSISEAWRTRREELLRSSEAVTQALKAQAGRGREAAALTVEVLEAAVRQFAGQYDERHGGFGPAPKFPRSHSLSLLLRAWTRSRDPQTLQMVTTTLQAMARGGLHDQVGGGFHRYSTDERWLVPHFEKMLYDQALLARTYVEAFQVTGEPSYAETARDIFAYVLRDLRDADGAFYSAEDAGEVGQEGECYVWTPEQIEAALGADEARLFSRVYGVTPEGNFVEEHRGAGGTSGRTILSIVQPLDAVAAREGTTPATLSGRLAAAREKLLAARAARPRPHRDDKILTDWNGLMIGALAYGARALDEPRYAQAASEAATFLLEHLQAASPAAGGTPSVGSPAAADTSSPAGIEPARSRDGRLLHRWRQGHAGIPAFLDDYAFLAWGLTDLYEATFEARWLAEAVRLTKDMARLFWDDAGGGFFFSGDRNERLIANTKEIYDGAVPSGNSVAALNLLRLAQLTQDAQLRQLAERQLQVFSGQARQAPSAFPQWLIALDAWLGPSQEIVIAGDPAAADTRAMVRAVHERFLPRAVLALHPTGPAAEEIERLAPFVKLQQPLAGKATAYVCEHYLCQLPTTDLSTLTALLDAAGSPDAAR
jgi:uncharacterized protein YyaL (SSP411 family)